MQPRAHALPDAVAQGLAPRRLFRCGLAERIAVVHPLLLRLVGKVRRDDRRLVVVVAAVEDVIHRVEHPLRAAHRTQLVDHQHFGVEHRPQDFHLRHPHRRVKRVLDRLQQLAIVAEQARHALVANQRLQNSDRQMRLAHAYRAHKQQAGLLDRILFDEPFGPMHRLDQLRVFRVLRIVLERPQLAVLIARGNLRRRQQPFRASFQPALAARHLAHVAAHDIAPSRSAADRAHVFAGSIHVIHPEFVRSSNLLPIPPACKRLSAVAICLSPELSPCLQCLSGGLSPFARSSAPGRSVFSVASTVPISFHIITLRSAPKVA